MTPAAPAAPAGWPDVAGGETPASGALLRVFVILPAMIRLSCGLAGAAAALAVRTPPVSTALLVGAVVLLTTWSIAYAGWTIRHGLAAWVSYLDVALTVAACLLIGRLVAPEVLPGEVSWVAILASTSVVVAQFALPLSRSVPAGLLIAAAYAVGAHRAGQPGEAAAHAGTLVVQTGFAAALCYLTRRSSRRADAAFADYRRSVARAAAARSARAAQRRQNRDLHDTVLSTLTLVSLGAVPAHSALLRDRAGEDLRALAALADARAHAGSESPVRLDDRLRTVLGRFPQLPASADLRPCTVPAAVADALADSATAALSNVVLHAPGAATELRLGRRGDAVVVEVRDDGPGFDPGAVPLHRYGLRESVHGRMATLGGRAVVDSAPGRGTLVRLEWSDAG
nr:ATP-binding protein [Micromonospora sp. DSM 115978]